jgi:transglutaminase-like putative cysteine protease
VAAQRWVLAGLLGAVLLNFGHIAPWCLPVAVAAVAWRIWSVRGAARMPGRAVRVAVLLILTVAVFVSFQTLNGLDAGASLLVAMMALKLMETQRVRDWLIVLGGSLFLLLAACLSSQSLLRVPFYGMELWLLCTALYAMGARNRPVTARVLLRASARNLLIALPLSVLLFLFFPRLTGTLWSMPVEQEAQTGLGDQMSPGDITNLVDSDEPAMHVRFDGTPPPPAERYWRGPVLHRFDGSTWSRLHPAAEQPSEVAFAPPEFAYTVTLEPNKHGVLIGLDMPVDTPRELPAVYTTFDRQIMSATPLNSAVSYHLVSSLQHRYLQPLSAAERALDLQLPYGRNPRTLELARGLRDRSVDDRAFVQAALDYLRDNGFEYTRSPQLLGRDSIDDLLFRTREGFCGHFASAFATMMRAGGVPAHIVTGYAGGAWNRFGQYLLIRQSNAHAWTEVWLEETGWMRVDPTAVVDARYANELDDVAAGELGIAGRGSALARWLRTSGQAWQAVNAWWQDQFVHFTAAKQMRLLGKLGFRDRDYQTLVAVLAIGGAIWLSLLAWRGRGLAEGKPRDTLGRSWRRLERALTRHVSARAPHEGPVAWGERLAAECPELSATVRLLTREYAQLRYGRESSGAALLRFDRSVRLFTARIGRRSPALSPRARATAATHRS